MNNIYNFFTTKQSNEKIEKSTMNYPIHYPKEKYIINDKLICILCNKKIINYHKCSMRN